MLNYNKIHSSISFQRTAKTTLSKFMGIANSTLIDRLEKENLTPDDVEKIADFFEKPIAYYFDREEKQAKILVAEEILNAANGPCANCAAMQAEINRLNRALVASKEETIAALKGENRIPQVNCG